MGDRQLNLVASEKFCGLQCDFYKDSITGYIAMTREQIGAALGYKNPRFAIHKIHSRHFDRIDKHSFRMKIDKWLERGIGYSMSPLKTGGSQETVFYTYIGIAEICHMSRMLRANQFFDFVWSVMDRLIKEDSPLLKDAEVRQGDKPDPKEPAPTPSSLQAKLWLDMVTKQLNIITERLDTDVISLLFFIYEEIELNSGIVVSDTIADYKKLHGIARCSTLEAVAAIPQL